MMPNLREDLVFAHRTNIERYRSLLMTHLTVIEREFVERRLREEERALMKIAQSAALVNTPNVAWTEPLHAA
jgi:hypothetical protein